LNFIFYPITNKGDPDIELCENLISSFGNPDIFIAVHFFGSIANLESTSEFTRKHKAWLIEDAAHLLKSDGVIGKYSNFLLFSPHKFLPIPDGAILVIKNDSFDKECPFNFPVFNNLYNLLINERHNFQVAHSFIWILKRVIQTLGYRTKINTFNYEDDPIQNEHLLPRPKMSKLGENLLLFLLEDIDTEETRRVTNYQQWLEVLEVNIEYETQEIFQGNKDIPYLLGLQFIDSVEAKYTYDFLVSRGIPVTTWPDLPPEIINNFQQYTETIHLRRSTIFFPLHRSIDINRVSFDS